MVSVAEQVSLCLAWSQTPEDTFSPGVAQMFWVSEFFMVIQLKLSQARNGGTVSFVVGCPFQVQEVMGSNPGCYLVIKLLLAWCLDMQESTQCSHSVNYRQNAKNLNTRKICCNHPNI